MNTHVHVVGQVLFLKLASIQEVNEEENEEPEDTQTLPADVPTPYFTPESPPYLVDPMSPPDDPTLMEIAYMIAARIPPKFARAAPSAPRVHQINAFPAFLDYDLTAGKAWSNMMKWGKLAEERRAFNTGVGLGLDVSGLEEKELSVSCHSLTERS